MYLKHRDVRGKYVVLTVDYEQAQLFVHWEDRCIRRWNVEQAQLLDKGVLIACLIRDSEWKGIACVLLVLSMHRCGNEIILHVHYLDSYSKSLFLSARTYIMFSLVSTSCHNCSDGQF